MEYIKILLSACIGAGIALSLQYLFQRHQKNQNLVEQDEKLKHDDSCLFEIRLNSISSIACKASNISCKALFISIGAIVVAVVALILVSVYN